MKKAFTLAEVLVTLGIIGIVAAMTIPTLFSKMEAQKKRAILKKAIAEISQANKMATLEKSVNFAQNYSMSNCNTQQFANTTSPCAILNENLKDVEHLGSYSDRALLTLASGANVAISSYGSGYLYIIYPTVKFTSIYDIGSMPSRCYPGANCERMDGFAFRVDDEGTLIPENDGVYNFIYGAE